MIWRRHVPKDQWRGEESLIYDVGTDSVGLVNDGDNGDSSLWKSSCKIIRTIIIIRHK